MKTVLLLMAILFSFSCIGGTKIPNCLGELCFGNEYQLRKDLPKILSISENKIPKKGDLCFKTQAGNYLLIRFLDHPSPNDKIETVFLTKDNICSRKIIQKEVVQDLKLIGELSIGDAYEDVGKKTGNPTYYHTENALERYSDADHREIKPIDAVNMYVTYKEDELLATWIFFEKKKLSDLKLACLNDCSF